MALEDGKDFVAGQHYLAYYDEYQPVAPFLLKCKRNVDGFPVFVIIGNEGNERSTLLMQHTNCTVSGDSMSVRAASNVAYANQLMNGIGMGAEWNRFFQNKYGYGNTDRWTTQRSVYEENRTGTELLEGIMSGNDPEGKGKFCLEHQTDAPAQPLTRAERLNTARNLASVVVELNRNTRFTVQDGTVKLLYNGWNGYVAEQRRFRQLIPLVEKAIENLEFPPGTYYLQKEY
jgi:hypothetical protein